MHVNPGGCSWLHAIVQVEKQNEDDGKKAIAAAFAGHRSCKHVFVVDRDIDIYDPLAVEWALATRFQADRDLFVVPDAPGNLLDPSARNGLVAKLGLDATQPLDASERKLVLSSEVMERVRHILSSAAPPGAERKG